MQKQKTMSLLYFLLSLACFIFFLLPYNKINMWSIIPGESNFSKFSHAFTGFQTLTNFQNIIATFLAVFQILCLITIILLFIFSLINLLNAFNVTNITIKIGKFELSDICLVITLILFVLSLVSLCLNFGYIANRNDFLNKNYNMDIQTKYATLYKITLAPILSTILTVVTLVMGYINNKKTKTKN